MKYLIALFVCVAAWAEGEKSSVAIQQADLPTAVQESLAHDKDPKATFRSFYKQIVDGQTFYSVRMNLDGKTRNILYRPSGKIEEIEQETPLEAIPAAAQAAIRKAAEKRQLRKVDVVTQGPKVLYEAELLVDGKRSSIRFDAKGQLR